MKLGLSPVRQGLALGNLPGAVAIRANASGGGASYDPAAEALFAEMSVEPDDTRKGHINTLIVSLKNASIWSALDRLWVLAAHDAQAAYLDWTGNGSAMTPVADPVFTTDEGVAGDGAASYVNTGFAPASDGVNFLLNDCCLGVYSRTATASNGTNIGARQTVDDGFARVVARLEGDFSLVAANHPTAGAIFVAMESAAGLSVVRRSGAGAQQMYKNGSEVGANTTASTQRPDFPLFLGASNGAGSMVNPSNHQHAAAFAGGALTPTQQAQLFTALETYLDAIGAGVVA